MKKLHLKTISKLFLLTILMFSITLTSCKKKKVEEEKKEETIPTAQAPNTFTKKVLIEDFTGESCGDCPNGDSIIESIVLANPNRVYAVAIHQGDFLQISQFDTLNGFLSVNGFPRSAINRVPATNTTNGQNGLLVFNRSQWSAHANKELLKTSIAGLKIETSLTGANIDITITCGTNQSLQDVRITVYIIENGMPESSSGAQNGAAPGYINNEVLRAVLTDGKGYVINLETTELATVSFSSIDLSTITTSSNVKILAFIHKFDQSSPDYEVLNVQEVHVGQNKDWD